MNPDVTPIRGGGKFKRSAGHPPPMLYHLRSFNHMPLHNPAPS